MVLALARVVAVVALPVKAPLKVVAVILPAVVSRYTPVSAIVSTAAAVAVGVVVAPSKYAFVVVPRVTFTLVSVFTVAAGRVTVFVFTLVTWP